MNGVKYKYEEIKDMDRRELDGLVPAEDRIEYRADEMVLFGSRMILGGSTYDCIKPELVDDGKPIHISVSILYSGTGHHDKNGLMERDDIWAMLKRENDGN